MKILLAADGSEFTRHAARHVVELARAFAQAPEIHLLNVHAPIPYARAAAVAGKTAVQRYYQEECEAALAVAREVLDAGGLAYQSSWIAGDVAASIAEYARGNSIDLIVMGSHGHGQLRNLALGSVADAVLRATKVPVLVVR